MVAPLTANVCITCHETFSFKCYSMIVCVKQFVISLPAISLGDWFFVSRKGGTGGGGLVYPKGENNMTVSGFGYENPSLGPFLSF